MHSKRKPKKRVKKREHETKYQSEIKKIEDFGFVFFFANNYLFDFATVVREYYTFTFDSIYMA